MNLQSVLSYETCICHVFLVSANSVLWFKRQKVTFSATTNLKFLFLKKKKKSSPSYLSYHATCPTMYSLFLSLYHENSLCLHHPKKNVNTKKETLPHQNSVWMGRRPSSVAYHIQKKVPNEVRQLISLCLP